MFIIPELLYTLCVKYVTIMSIPLVRCSSAESCLCSTNKHNIIFTKVAETCFCQICPLCVYFGQRLPYRYERKGPNPDNEGSVLLFINMSLFLFIHLPCSAILNDTAAKPYFSPHACRLAQLLPFPGTGVITFGEVRIFPAASLPPRVHHPDQKPVRQCPIVCH